jgi:hypothetical protein
MFRPSHISAVEIAGIGRIGLKFFERLDASALSAALRLRACLLLVRFSTFVIASNVGEELRPP